MSFNTRFTLDFLMQTIKNIHYTNWNYYCIIKSEYNFLYDGDRYDIK